KRAPPRCYRLSRNCWVVGRLPTSIDGRAIMRMVIFISVAVLFLTQIALAPLSVAAQPEDETAEQAKTAEFVGLYARWQQAQDPEEKIKLGERALALEPSVIARELATPRERIKGELWFGIAYAYHYRSEGSRDDNLEKAITAYEAALTVFTREAF